MKIRHWCNGFVFVYAFLIHPLNPCRHCVADQSMLLLILPPGCCWHLFALTRVCSISESHWPNYPSIILSSFCFHDVTCENLPSKRRQDITFASFSREYCQQRQWQFVVFSTRNVCSIKKWTKKEINYAFLFITWSFKYFIRQCHGGISLGASKNHGNKRERAGIESCYRLGVCRIRIFRIRPVNPVPAGFYRIIRPLPDFSVTKSFKIHPRKYEVRRTKRKILWIHPTVFLFSNDKHLLFVHHNLGRCYLLKLQFMSCFEVWVLFETFLTFKITFKFVVLIIVVRYIYIL